MVISVTSGSIFQKRIINFPIAVHRLDEREDAPHFCRVVFVLERIREDLVKTSKKREVHVGDVEAGAAASRNRGGHAQ